MADPAPDPLIADLNKRVRVLEQCLTSDEARLAKLEKGASVVESVSKWFDDHSAMAHLLNSVLAAALGALLTWLSGVGDKIVTKEVPGPERVIVKEVPVQPGTVKTNEK